MGQGLTYFNLDYLEDTTYSVLQVISLDQYSLNDLDLFDVQLDINFNLSTEFILNFCLCK